MRKSRLGVVIRLAQIEERKRLGELARAAQRAEGMNGNVARIGEALQRSREHRIGTGPRTAADLAQSAQHWALLELERVRAEKDRRDATVQLEAARARAATARLRVRALEKTQKKRADEARREDMRRAEKRREALEVALREEADRESA
jgi:hypothetical protein